MIATSHCIVRRKGAMLVPRALFKLKSDHDAHIWAKETKLYGTIEHQRVKTRIRWVDQKNVKLYIHISRYRCMYWIRRCGCCGDPGGLLGPGEY